MLKRYVGRSEQLTMERLEELIHLPANEDYMTFQTTDSVQREPKNESNESNSSSLQFEPLLMTKLQLPRLQKALLPREHLLELLDRALDCKLTVIAGPAGYAKTTLVGQWIASRSIRADTFRVAYITLDERDNDPLRFWRYIIAACQTWQPDLGKEALELLRMHRLPPFKSLDMMLTVLLNELNQLATSSVLVLDDFHVLDPSVVTEMLSFFLEHLPTTFHLIVLIRGDPPLSLTRLRARNELLDIYPPLLAFTLEEARTFFAQELPFALSPNVLRQIYDRIQGWPTGLRLFARAIHEPVSPQNIELLLEAFAGSHWSIRDYFCTEVLQTLPPLSQEFLLQTSILPRLSVSLCDAIMERSDSLQQINTLQSGDLFLIPLDGSGEWSFYQSLFAEAMQTEAYRRLDNTSLRELAVRASIWYEQHGLLAEAIETALNGTEWKRAAKLIKSFIESKERSKVPTVPEWYVLNRWMGRLPEAELELHPDLCLQYALSLLFILMERAGGADEKEKERVNHLLQVAEQSWRDVNKTEKLAEVFAFRALMARQDGKMFQAVTWANQSLAWLPADNRTWRTLSLTVVGIGELVNGDLNTAQRYLLEALKISELQGNSLYARATRGMLSWLSFERGELHRAATQFRQMQVEAREQEDHDDIARTQLGLAQIEYQWNNLQAAELAAREALTISEQMREEEVQARARIVLAQIEYVRGQVVQAQHLLIAWQARRIQASPTPFSDQLSRDVQAALAHIQLATGNFVAVARWSTDIEHSEIIVPLLQSQREQLLQLRFLLSQGEISTVIVALEGLLKSVLQTGHMYLGLDVQIALTLAYARQGSDDKARETLYEVLKVTHNEGYLRLFLDEGEVLLSILRGLLLHLREKELIAYARHLVSIFALESGIQVQRSQSETFLLPEPLSPQERKVLRLLVAGNSNAEIARELIVSVNTIRTQIQSIYRKLNINNRIEARAVANQLGLLS